MKAIDFNILEKRIQTVTSIPTWTKRKHTNVARLKEFLRNYDITEFENNVIYGVHYSWSYEKIYIPYDKRGHLKKYREMYIVLLCVYRDALKRDYIAIPLKKGHDEIPNNKLGQFSLN